MSDEVSTAMRYLKMLAGIPRSPRFVSVRDMHASLAADGYEVSLRTLQRDLVNLSTRFPIIASETIGPQGNRWSWKEDSNFIDLPGIDPSTAIALLLSQKHLESVLPRGVTYRLEPYFRRSEAVLNRLDAHALRRWKDKIRVLARGPELATPKIERIVQDVIYDALLVSRQIEARYRGRGKDVPSEIVLNPLGIVLKEGITYLVATAWEYPDLRHYPLHRFVSVKALESPARIPATFRLDSYIAEAKAFSYAESPGQIVLDLAIDRGIADHLMERPLSLDQTVGPYPDNRFRLTATVSDTAELRWWLLGFGDQVVVLGPNSLRSEFRRMTISMANGYARRVRKSGSAS